MEWKSRRRGDDETAGIRWLKLYNLYAIHGGCDEIIKSHKRNPLRKRETLQMAIAKAKSMNRKLVTHCCD